jgi:ElaB/YqjD/DUF883 family membrane-anchored ribosome-binding protein
MATTPLERPVETVREYAADAAQYAKHLEHDARMLKLKATDALEDAVHTATRAVTRRIHELEDLCDAAENRIRRAPFTAVGTTFAAGVMIGAIAALVSLRAHRR